jgi:SsrA-binding protein
MGGRKDAPGEKTVASNRRARHDYLLLEQVECGIQLTGDEVKSLKGGRASLTDCYARVRAGEMWLEGMHVPAYEQGDKRTHQPLRPRKLLLHRSQIAHLDAEVREKGLALVPLRVYVAHGMLKVEIALARGKRQHEKRHAIAKRDAQREAERELGRRR